MTTDWYVIWSKIASIPAGMAMKVTRSDMALLMDCNRTGIDRIMPVSDAYITEAINEWPMLSEYKIEKDPVTEIFTFYRPDTNHPRF
jgi:hypothetical protein